MPFNARKHAKTVKKCSLLLFLEIWWFQYKAWKKAFFRVHLTTIFFRSVIRRARRSRGYRFRDFKCQCSVSDSFVVLLFRNIIWHLPFFQKKNFKVQCNAPLHIRHPHTYDRQKAETLYIAKLCNQVHSLSLFRWRTLTLLKI